jgi:hypothetical protein
VKRRPTRCSTAMPSSGEPLYGHGSAEALLMADEPPFREPGRACPASGAEDRRLHLRLYPGRVAVLCGRHGSARGRSHALPGTGWACGPALPHRVAAITPAASLLGVNLCATAGPSGSSPSTIGLHLITISCSIRGSILRRSGRYRQAPLTHTSAWRLRHPRAAGPDLQQRRHPRMGGQAWARLHRLVYVAAIGAVLHFVLVVNPGRPSPGLCGHRGRAARLRIVRSMVKKPAPRQRPA